MSKVRLDFLNWRPDEDDFENPLIQAKNVVHQSEGWVPYERPTAGAISAHGNFATVPSMVIRPVGTDNQHVVAWLDNGTVAGNGFTMDLSIGLLLEGSGNYTLTSTYTTVTTGTVSTKNTLNNISCFDVCEGHDASGDPVLFFVAIAEGSAATGTSDGANIHGWSTI